MSGSVALEPSLSAGEWVDLSHTYDSSTQYWPGFRRFKLTETFNGMTEDGYWARSYDFEGAEHGGTHMDAPSHIGKGGNWTLDQIPLTRLVAHVALVDISERCQADPDSALTAADLTAWRAEHGPFQSPTVVLVRTGNAAHWSDTNRYWGFPADYQPDETAQFGSVQAPPMRFPGLDLKAAQLLAGDPAVVGVGLDTPSLDPGYSTRLEAHQALFAANKFGLEHVGDMSRVPPTGATLVALPMKIGGGSGGPCRVLVRLPPRPGQ